MDTTKIDYVICGEVLNIIQYSVSYKAPGPDVIFNVMLKHVSYSTAILLTRMFNKCIELGYFPKVWKLAKVVPVLKPGKDPCLGSSYRSISLMSAISKIFERIIHTWLETHVSANNILPDVQFGFRRQRSAVMQLQRVLQIVSNAKTSWKSTGISLLDVEKAFDSVWHNGLIYKLRLQGFPSYLVHLVQNYLSGRTLAVYVNSEKSDSYSNCAGVPQGSVIGPLFYNCYTADVPSLRSGTDLALYADNSAIFCSSRTLRHVGTGL